MQSELTKFRVNEPVYVDIDWSDKAKNKRCRIYRLFMSGSRQYAEVIWVKNHDVMDRLVGTIFSVDDELRKV